MLTQWNLKNFKSVKRETILDLAPLTVFAGANSSGKSTIIQSILLTAQTLQSPVHGKPVVLNGHVIRLGACSDLMSASELERDISLGFKLTPAIRGDSAVDTARLVSESYSYVSKEIAEKTKSVECLYSFTNVGTEAGRDVLDLQPNLTSAKIKIDVSGEEAELNETEIAIFRSKVATGIRASDLNLPLDALGAPERASLEYEVLKPQNLKPGRRYYRGVGSPINARCAGAVLSHFLPLRLTIVYDAIEEEIARQLEPLVAYRDARYHADDDTRWLEASPEARARLLQMLRNFLDGNIRLSPSAVAAGRALAHMDLLERTFTLRNYIAVLQALPHDLRTTLMSLIAQEFGIWRSMLRGSRPPRYVIRYAPLPPLTAFAVDYIKSYFASKVKYLGPLRDEPKPVYPLAGATDSKDVGFKGEHTASVLDIHKNSLIEYIPTRSFSNRDHEPAVVQVPLSVAVADWLSYMGVVQQVKTVDRGKLGHELKVATTDAEPEVLHDLTHVGVGVSQVLPILVLSLLAETDSTLIFEQPELHLHPRVQTRLAEFFVSMIKLKKQCLVETHSEYLINRLRYLAAASEGKAVSEDVILYFVEKAGGQSSYTPIRINEYGAIPDWPKGFFDESEETAALTLKAAMLKRKRVSS